MSKTTKKPQSRSGHPYRVFQVIPNPKSGVDFLNLDLEDLRKATDLHQKQISLRNKVLIPQSVREKFPKRSVRRLVRGY